MITGSGVPDLLSIWRSPIDKVAIMEAESLEQRQPRGTIVYYEDFTQITIFNYGQYITAAGGITNADAALENMFDAMRAASSPYGNDGGLAYILQQNYLVNAYDPNIQKHEVPDQCNLLACGMGGDKGNANSTHFYHFKISPLAAGLNTSTFLTCEGNHTTGGKWFRGIAFEWAQTNAKVGDICISAGTWNCIAVDCNFTNCPTAFYAKGESSGLERCTINYLTGSPNNAVAVYLQAVLSFASGGVYHQDSVAGGGPTGCTAIALGGGGGMGSLFHGVVCNLHLGEWSYGIHYGFNPGVSGTNVTAILAQSYITCVMMQPPASGNNEINGEKYTACTFNKSASSSDPSAIVFIDTNGQGNGQINDIEFSNCSVYSQAGGIQLSGLYCYKITSGSNIRIIGGTASNAGPGTATAGIAIVPTVVPGGPAGPGRITVLGVDLTPTYPQAGGGGPQEYALFISANLQDVMTVDDCRMSGYTNPPVRVTGTVTGNLYIRNCQGYNDQNTAILSGTSHLPVSSPVSAGNASTLSGGTNYYGPSLVMFTNSGGGGVTFSINGVSQTVPAGGFVTVYLASPWDTIQFSSHPLAAFTWIGK